jgi:prepilin-type N-terminal cleavage/methylation domain-containing protein
MKQRLKNQNGTTLVELIVCMVLLAIFTLAAVTLIQPSAQAYMDIQQQTRAQNLADALIETIRGEVLEANGYIRFTDGATVPNDTDVDKGYDSIFKEKTGVKRQWKKTEFVL